jgi:hypothetical protein
MSTFWAPVVNLVRDPRWGRNIETPGEDPLLTSQYAINFVTGMGSNPADSNHIQASACCKHFVANELEKWNGTDRNHFNAEVGSSLFVLSSHAGTSAPPGLATQPLIPRAFGYRCGCKTLWTRTWCHSKRALRVPTYRGSCAPVSFYACSRYVFDK